MSLARAFGIGLLACASCFLGDTPTTLEAPEYVGPAPLRRLTNEEYLNALHDLFPAVSVALPPLPEDTIIAGFDNAAEAQQPSDVAIARYEQIANLYAAALAGEDGPVRSACAPSTACATELITTIGRRIFRRPLAPDELLRFQTKFAAWQSAVDFGAGLELTLSAMLQSPQFLYRPEPTTSTTGDLEPVDSYALATRLSFFLWASTPDDALLDAAASGTLKSEPGVRAQAERMLDDDRARRTFWSFHRQWLGLDRILSDEHTYRTPEIDPKWTPATPISAEHETELFVENVLASHGTLHDLLTSQNAWVDGETARIYGLPAPADPTAFTAAALPSERAGLLTRIAFLAGTSHRGGTSPPIRGNAVLLRMLCEPPVSPPPNADLSMPMAPPNSGPETTRMLFEQRTAPAQCQACHVSLNGIGFGFESFDAAGAHRTTEDTLPIDDTGVLLGTDTDGPFTGAVALSQILDRSTDVKRCATQQWLRYALGRGVDPAEQPLLDAWTSAFVASDGDVRALVVSIVTSPTFRFQKVNH
jgi:hypothetical protein